MYILYILNLLCIGEILSSEQLYYLQINAPRSETRADRTSHYALNLKLTLTLSICTDLKSSRRVLDRVTWCFSDLLPMPQSARYRAVGDQHCDYRKQIQRYVMERRIGDRVRVFREVLDAYLTETK